MSNVLFLTAEEQQKFQSLPQQLQNAWQQYIQEETIDAFEDAKQMEYRMQMFDAEKYPEVKEILQQLQECFENNQDIDNVSLNSLSTEALQMLYSCIGAVGVSAFIEGGLAEASVNSDIESLAALSRIRHGLLRSNQEFFANA